MLVNCAWLPTRFLVTSNATPRRVYVDCHVDFFLFFLKALSLSLSASKARHDESGTDHLRSLASRPSPFDDDRSPRHDR